MSNTVESPEPSPTAGAGTNPVTHNEGVPRPSYRILLLLASISFILDQVTKWMVIREIPYGTYFLDTLSELAPVEIISDRFYLVHIGNRGAAWGILSGQSTLLAILGCAVLAFIYFQREQLGLRRPTLQLSFGFLIGGILGNLVDRFVHGHVTDFLDVHLPALPFLGFGGYRWPAFNLADSFIFTGIALYLIYSFFFEKRTPKEKVQTSED
ncbi:MAG: signal peptidase II [Puniceicoccaceae bacterium]